MKYFVSLLSLVVVFFLQSCQIDAVTHFNKDYSGSTSTTIDLGELLEFASAFDEEGDADMGAIDSLFMLFDGSIENDSVSMFMDSMKTTLHDAGMKNFNFSRDGDYGLKASYDFDNLDVFNSKDLMEQLMQALGGSLDSEELASEDMFDSMPSQTSISREGKWLIIDLFGMSYDDFKAEMAAELEAEREAAIANGEEADDLEMDIEESLDMAIGMMGMMGDMYQMSMTYTFDRKVKEVVSPLDVKSDKHSVSVEYSLADVLETLKEEGSVQIRVKLK